MNPLSPARLYCALLTFSLISTVSLHGQESKSLASAPEQTKAEITQALRDFLTFNSDPAQHESWWADDLVYTTSAGLVKTKPMIIQAFADAAKPGTARTEPRASYSAEDVLVRLYDDTAALTFRLVAHNADGTVATYRNSGTLLHRHGKWQVVTWQATKETAEKK
jgi:hypothetical protein